MNSSSPSIKFSIDQKAAYHYKSFTNLMNEASKMYTNRPFAHYFSNGKYKILTYANIDHLATNLACRWAKEARDVKVATLIADHNIDYLIIMLALMKLRVTLLALCPKNSEAAVVNLLEKTKSSLVFASKKHEPLVKSSAEKVKEKSIKMVTVDRLDIEASLNEALNSDYEKILDLKFSEDDIRKDALIIHSSGSTGLPKPIYLSNQYLINIISFLHMIKEVDPEADGLARDDVFLNGVPLYHVFGFYCVFQMATIGGSVVFTQNLPSSGDEIKHALISTNATLMCAPPATLEQILHQVKVDKEFQEALRRLRFILFGGAPLKRKTGEWFHKHGINLRVEYGTTEIGAIMAANMNSKSDNWSAMRSYIFDPRGNDYCVFETNDSSEPDIKHMYVRRDSPTLATNVSNRPDGGFSTGDLFKEHPDYPGYYIYIGRRDDILVMENGEKANPAPQESVIGQCPLVKQVAVFGNGRPCTAALIVVDEEQINGQDEDEIFETIFQAVEDANKDSPRHSIILREMVKILPKGKTLPLGPKGNMLRKKAESEYEECLDQMYKEFFEGHSAQGGNTKPLSDIDIESILIRCVSDILKVPESSLDDHHQSLFELGLNSLTATQLRSRIIKHIQQVPQNFIYRCPTIAGMKDALSTDGEQNLEDYAEQKYDKTMDILQKYIQKAEKELSVCESKKDISNEHEQVILLTGATGSLGSFILSNLLKNNAVKKVFCMVRGKGSNAIERLKESFDSRYLDSLLLSSNNSRLEVLSIQSRQGRFGLSDKLYHKLKDEVTTIIHAAWILDFNMSVDYYDQECIPFLYNLIKLAHRQTNPMHFHLISSISAVSNLKSSKEIEEKPYVEDTHVSMPTGYAQSKFIAEALMDYLVKKKNFPCFIERLGQVCGDTENGVWNALEQYPLMLMGGQIMKKMPKMDIKVDWIPVNDAANSISEIVLRTANTDYKSLDGFVFHIVNPNTITWPKLLDIMKSCGLNFESVPFQEWVELLSHTDDTNPASPLLPYYQANVDHLLNMPGWKTEKAAQMAPSLSKACPVGPDLFKKFLVYWKSIGYYK
ncbi:acetyl-CoA synthetase-like protein [Rhizopus microsporus ATCC 52813]|uniref:Acetyl-CoA synthetase-like protein n=1 Tax=Rhizopus microsporus ATCC 52813 TaxID=1340429 RepID=A0A2G4T5A9_RHIZD|nr:acetyl-CoA synthetase-like protein [Rhizopus microsporus ATCC 52813]PHZ16213.1 acetyl-CoA synthetase-like protein [Rhizopus microsporus ATCC 52813]